MKMQSLSSMPRAQYFICAPVLVRVRFFSVLSLYVNSQKNDRAKTSDASHVLDEIRGKSVRCLNLNVSHSSCMWSMESVYVCAMWEQEHSFFHLSIRHYFIAATWILLFLFINLSSGNLCHSKICPGIWKWHLPGLLFYSKNTTPLAFYTYTGERSRTVAVGNKTSETHSKTAHECKTSSQ